MLAVSADDRGRFTLGQDSAGEDMELVVVRTEYQPSARR